MKMRLARKNRQKLKYALYKGREDIAQTDSGGEIVYDDSGEPLRTGSKRANYKRPVEFFANISSELTQDDLTAFGIDNSTGKAKIVYKRDEFPFKTGTLIWHKSDVKYLKNGFIDENSADYRIEGVDNTGLNIWRVLLQRIVK